MSMWTFRAFSDLGFHLCFQFFRCVDSKKAKKSCLNALTLNLSYTRAWSLLIYLGLFGQFMWNNVCQEVGTQSKETVKLRFFYLSRDDFLEIDVFYSILELICKKIFYFRFFI